MYECMPIIKINNHKYTNISSLLNICLILKSLVIGVHMYINGMLILK